MIYLAQFTLHRQDYPDTTSEEKVTRLVEAADENEAERKVIRHYDDQSISYCVSYWVSDLTIHPTIT